MRKLLYLTLGFAAACGLLVYVEDPKWQLAGAAAVLVLGAVAGPDPRVTSRGVLVLLGLLAGWGWFHVYQAFYLQSAARLDGQRQWTEIRACDYGSTSEYGVAVDGSLVLDEKTYQVRVYLTDDREITPGDYLYGTFRFRMTTPGEQGENPYYQGKGIFLLAYQADAVTVVDYPPTRRDLPARARRKIAAILDIGFSRETTSFAKALLLGDTSGLDYATDTALKVSGIRHVAAVSGLHVSILFALISVITLRRRFLTALLGIPVLFLFAAVAGFSPSVSRACLMCGLMLLSMVLNREYDGVSALAFGVLVLLLVNPLSITSVSLQLSVASMAGIYLFEGRIRKWIISRFGHIPPKSIKSVLVNWFSSSVSVSLSAMILTTPLCAWYFGMVSLVSPVTNLLTLWMVSLSFYGIMAVIALYLLAPAAAVLAAEGVVLLIRVILLLAKTISDLPMAAVYTTSPYIVVWLGFVYMMLFWFRITDFRRPDRLACCTVLGLCLALLAGWMEPGFWNMRFSVLDVGQGQCLVFQTEGKTYMVDCGGDSDTAAADTAAQFLLSQGIDHLDGLILTHLDSDHAGGAEALMERMEVGLLILPAADHSLRIPEGISVVYAQEPLMMAVGFSRITIYPPLFPGNSNEMSLCILFDTQNCDILVTGDRNGFGERSLLRNAQIPDVDVLVAGHHGSKNSTCQELLEAVKPEVVCISSGAENPYGHPAQETLQRLERYGCSVYRTDVQGTITIRR